MAVLLVGMSVAAVLMTAAMPVWKQVSRREKEAELIFRGQQYVRAIGLFQKRSGPGVLPPNVDVLVTGHFLRKKFKDPITDQDFDLLSPVQAAGQAPGTPGRGGTPQQQGRGAVQGTGSVVGAQPGGRGAVGGIIGVASKSKDASLRIYNGRTHYNEWQFVFVQQVQAPAAAGPGGGGRAGAPPQPGGPLGGTGRPPFGSPSSTPVQPRPQPGGGQGGTGRPPFGPATAPPVQPRPR